MACVHLHTQMLCFLASSDRTTIIVGEHDDRNAVLRLAEARAWVWQGIRRRHSVKSHPAGKKNRRNLSIAAIFLYLEARAGVEPTYTDLQSMFPFKNNGLELNYSDHRTLGQSGLGASAVCMAGIEPRKTTTKKAGAGLICMPTS